MTNELQQNRYDRLIRRVGGIIGTGSKVSEVLTELFPTIDVETNKGELQLLSGVILGMGAALRSGTGGERSSIQLFNPAGSGTLITVTDILIGTNTTQTLHIGRTTILGDSGVGTQLTRDSRRPITSRPVGQIFTDAAVALVDGNILLQGTINTPFNFSPHNGVMILAPGTGISVGCTAADTRITVTFFWRERVAEQSELNI